MSNRPMHITQTTNSISLSNMPPAQHRQSHLSPDVVMSRLSLEPASQSEFHAQNLGLNGMQHSESMSSTMSLESIEDRNTAMQLQPGLTQVGQGQNGKMREGSVEIDGMNGHDDVDEHVRLNGNGGTENRGGLRAVIHIEVRLFPRANILHHVVLQLVESYINENFDLLAINSELEGWQEQDSLRKHVESVYVTDCALEEEYVPLEKLRLALHVYRSSSQQALDEFAAGGDDDDEDAENDVMAATVRELPSRGLIGLWDSLIYEEDIKPRLLNYIYTTLLFSDADVDFNIVTWNRVVLLHGPPGTGKTSLCRALAQKLAIRLSDRYSHGKLVEINSHSLFSKWFSESGKLVQKLFARVTEMVEDENGFVVVLIDEVESLTAARAGAMTGTEPSDALRVVNALLTQLDKLKNRKNVLVMSTSNIAQAIDSAFVDRADIKQYIGLPPPQAVYWILQGCLQELMNKGIIAESNILDWKMVEKFQERFKNSSVSLDHLGPAARGSYDASTRLYELAQQCQGMSGRTLRRLPVLAHARYIGYVHGAKSHGEGGGTSVEEWIEAMDKVVSDEGEQMMKLEELVGTGKI